MDLRNNAVVAYFLRHLVDAPVWPTFTVQCRRRHNDRQLYGAFRPFSRRWLLRIGCDAI